MLIQLTMSMPSDRIDPPQFAPELRGVRKVCHTHHPSGVVQAGSTVLGVECPLHIAPHTPLTIAWGLREGGRGQEQERDADALSGWKWTVNSSACLLFCEEEREGEGGRGREREEEREGGPSVTNSEQQECTIH